MTLMRIVTENGTDLDSEMTLIRRVTENDLD